MTALPHAIKAFQVQINACRAGGSPFSAAVLEVLAIDFAKQGPVYHLAHSWDENAVRDAMALRLLGGLHRLALDDAAPELAKHFPSVGGAPGQSLAADVIATVSGQHDFLSGYMSLPPQTNEVGRSSALLGGFLTLVQETAIPLRLLEIGSSAGLNLFWDLFAYANGAFEWGEPSDVVLRTEWSGPLPPLAAKPDVVERAGCDIAPVDVQSQSDCRRLESYVWADQPERLDRARGAIAIAQRTAHILEKADAGEWLTRHLAEPADGVCSVVFHSIMWQYMAKATQDRARQAIVEAGRRVTASAPVAWLRLELTDPTSYPVVTLTTWPGERERVLGTAHFHGAWVKWGDDQPGSWA